ncbi:hypothetical protein D9M73_118410 [compost metagenome]
MARLVARPFLVHVLIDARQRAQHLATTRIEPDVGADRVHYVDRQRLLQLPRARFERIRLGGQRADRAQVDDIARQFARHGMFEIRHDLHVLATPDRADFLDAGHFLGKADAARALDTARHHRLDDRPHIFLGDRALILVIARRATAISHRLVLQIAFATLIANRAIKRMVDEQELHHPFARILDHWRVGEDLLLVRRRQRAGSLRLRRSGLHLDQAHAAIARDAQPFMIAEARDFLAGEFARLEHSGPGGNFNLDTIDFDNRHYSAASIIGLNPPPRFSVMRRSISGRKCLIRPWIGQAAASPSAQIVWPSTCLVT